MEKGLNEEKRKKFIVYAGKRVNNVLHDIQILEPMARSNSYDFTKQDVEDMFNAMQETLNNAKEEFYKKFDEKAKAEKKTFVFSSNVSDVEEASDVGEVEEVANVTQVTENVEEQQLPSENGVIENLEDTQIDEDVEDILL